MIPLAVIAAYRDSRLKRRDLIVYARAIETLSFFRPLPFKCRTEAPKIGMAFQHVAASVQRLTVCGYLERGPTDGRMRTYLLRTHPIPRAMSQHAVTA